MSSLIRLRPHLERQFLGQGRTVVVCAADGRIRGDDGCGVFFASTRLLVRFRWLLDGAEPQFVAGSNVEQDSWLAYYVADAEGRPHKGRSDPAQKTLELRVARVAGEGLHEDVELTNYTGRRARIELALEIDGDFADEGEMHGRRRQRGTTRRSFRRRGSGSCEIALDYRAHHRLRVQGHDEERSLRRGVVVRVESGGSRPRWSAHRLRFGVELEPKQRWSACALVAPVLEGRRIGPQPPCPGLAAARASPHAAQTRRFARRATRFSDPEAADLTGVVVQVLEQARADLASLRLPHLDHGPRSWTLAAGLPLYIALFGRDTLICAQQASMLAPDILRGTLTELRRWQGRAFDDWRDEQPGRHLHEAQDGPLAALGFTPFARYYGSACTGAFYARALAALWRWTADRDFVQAHLDAARSGMEWIDRFLDRDGDGLFEYETRSVQGLRNQGWKDSADAIVHADGSLADPPIGTCEMQAFVYAARRELATVLRDLGFAGEALDLERAAAALRRRFDQAFWMRDGFLALGIDREKRQIRSIASNAGHCLATIVSGARARRVGRRLMAPDLFSGWGVRTLSAAHTAYDPFSYHRGSVWPVEQGELALALARVGLRREAEALCRAVFEAAALFDHGRLPEVFSGHPRDALHPFPAFYPRTNSPQAWSSSTVFRLVECLLGLVPDAPRGTLHLDPRLPSWLPRLSVRGLQVGPARVTLDLERGATGATRVRIAEQRGRLIVRRSRMP